MAKRHIIPIFVPHAGCPNACVFCDQKKITGQSTPVTPEMVRSEIEAALPAAGENCELAFYGGSFTAINGEVQEGLLSAVQPYLESGAVGTIRLSTRPDAMDEAVVQRLKRFGVDTVELGCQSMDDGVLMLTNRGHTAADCVKATQMLKAAGIQVILQMMTGLPGDDGSASRETAEKIIALRPDGVRIYPTVVLRGTELERRMREGTYEPHGVDAAVELCAGLYEMFLSAEIPVIRLGLNPTELLSSGEAVAGAYHPALGELVLSRMYLSRARILLQSCPQEKNVILLVHPKRISVMVGQKRENLLRLRQEFGLSGIKVQPHMGELWEISLKKA